MAKIHKLSAGHTLTVSVSDGSAHVKQIEDASIGAVVTSSKSFGPYLVERNFTVSDNATVTIAAVTESSASLFTHGAGAPVSAVRAALAVNPAGDDNGLVFTAKQYGTDGNLISVEYVDPAANDAALSVSVFNTAITVHLATGEAGAITSTAAEVLAAVNASIPAAKLVTVALDATDTTPVDGAGVVTAIALALLENGAGTAIGESLKGGYYIDTNSGITYTNTGTQAVPVWTGNVSTATFGATAGIVNGLAALHLYGAGVPVDYTDGDPVATGEGTSPKGAIYSDTTNGFVYRNSGTQAQPIWTKLADAA